MLDDFAPLRQIQPKVFNDEGTLFAVGRPARAFEELGYYRAQGDNIASPNPPAGALLTYYLRDDLAGAGNGTDAPKMVLHIADSSGKMVRQIDASNTAGLHRTPWDLREPPLPGGNRGGRGAGRGDAPGEETTPPAGRGGRGGRGARNGPLVRSSSPDRM